MTTRNRKKKINNILNRNLTQTKTFNLLSIGQRGVGRTVFMIGNYEELQSNHLTKQRLKSYGLTVKTIKYKHSENSELCCSDKSISTSHNEKIEF